MTRARTPAALAGASAGGAGEAPGRDAGREAAIAFSSLLVKELLKASLGGGSGSGLFPRGVAGEVYRDFFLDEMARAVAAAPSFPLTAHIAAYLGSGGDSSAERLAGGMAAGPAPSPGRGGRPWKTPRSWA